MPSFENTSAAARVVGAGHAMLMAVSYRDELAAALARIQALEGELEARESVELQTLRVVNASLKKEIRRLMALHQEALVEIEALQGK